MHSLAEILIIYIFFGLSLKYNLMPTEAHTGNVFVVVSLRSCSICESMSKVIGGLSTL